MIRDLKISDLRRLYSNYTFHSYSKGKGCSKPAHYAQAKLQVQSPSSQLNKSKDGNDPGYGSGNDSGNNLGNDSGYDIGYGSGYDPGNNSGNDQ